MNGTVVFPPPPPPAPLLLALVLVLVPLPLPPLFRKLEVGLADPLNGGEGDGDPNPPIETMIPAISTVLVVLLEPDSIGNEDDGRVDVTPFMIMIPVLDAGRM